MKGNIICSLAVICVFFGVVKGLSCPDFEPGEICPDPGPCPYGTAPDMCYQCDECAKGPGEPCGGIWNHGGTCGPKLSCTNPDPADYDNQDPGECVPEY